MDWNPVPAIVIKHSLPISDAALPIIQTKTLHGNAASSILNNFKPVVSIRRKCGRPPQNPRSKTPQPSRPSNAAQNEKWADSVWNFTIETQRSNLEEAIESALQEASNLAGP